MRGRADGCAGRGGENRSMHDGRRGAVFSRRATEGKAAAEGLPREKEVGLQKE